MDDKIKPIRSDVKIEDSVKQEVIVNEHVVEVLEILLEGAKKGEFQFLTYLTLGKKNSYSHNYIGLASNIFLVDSGLKELSEMWHTAYVAPIFYPDEYED